MNKIIAILIFFILPGSLMAKEAILDFHSDIIIQKDSSMLVSETITVNAEHVNIRRGIYRDFPTKYKDRLGHNYEVGFDLISVERDGHTEPFHTEMQRNGIRIYIGSRNSYISKGNHTYKLTYKTTRQLGYFEKHDELYWNVTGNGWRFPITKASADVTLPDYVDTDLIKTTGYTGRFGSQEKAVQIEIIDGKHLHFETTRSLLQNEGLSIVAGWPKGYVQEPTFETRVAYFLDDNPNVIPGLLGIILVFTYYLLIWHGIGRDRLSPVNFPIYKPPKNFSAAACRYLYRMEYDNKAFATAIVALAIKGYLKIHKTRSDKYNLKKLKNADKQDMAAGEYALFTGLFKSLDNLPLTNIYHTHISAAIDRHKKSLEKNYHKVYFVTNSGWVILGAIISLLCLIVFFSYSNNFIQNGPPNVTAFIIVFVILFFSKFFGKLLARFTPATTRAIKFGFILLCIAIGVYLILPVSLLFISVITLIVGVNIIFYELLKSPTRAGKPVMERLRGLKHYLEVAEEDDLNAMYAPKKTPETFEFFFPFAMALDVEKAWGEKFADVFAQYAAAGKRYKPGWTDDIDGWGRSDSKSFISSFSNTLTSEISSSSVAPGSSSGFSGGGGGGGGGGSGGGGGGGGGGGW